MNIVTPLLWISILRPYPGFVPISTALAIGGRVIDALILAAAILALTSRGHAAHPPSIFRPLWFTSIALWIYSCGLLFYANLMGLTISIRDLFEPHRLFLMALLLLFSFNHSPAQIIHSWKKLWVGSVLIYLLIVLSQNLNLDIFNSLVELIWGASKTKYVPELGISRQTGFFINPNWAGVFLSWALTYFLIVDSMSSFLRFSMVSVTIFLVIMSGSRTGLICCFFVFGVYLFIISWRRTLSVSFITAGLLYIASLYLDLLSFFPVHHRELLTTLIERRDLSEVSTFGDRLEIWAEALKNYFFPSYGLGTGPLKFAVASVLDNQYIKWLVWYGVPGLICHLIFYMTVSVQLYKASRKGACYESRLATALLVMLLALLLASITGAFFDVTQLSFLFMMLCGGVLKATAHYEKDALVQGSK